MSAPKTVPPVVSKVTVIDRLVSQGKVPVCRVLTAFSANDLRSMKYADLMALATDHGIAREAAGKPRKAVDILADIMSARLSESRRLGHQSRKAVVWETATAPVPAVPGEVCPD